MNCINVLERKKYIFLKIKSNKDFQPVFWLVRSKVTRSFPIQKYKSSGIQQETYHRIAQTFQLRPKKHAHSFIHKYIYVRLQQKKLSSFLPNTMIVICLEGSHGSGKSTICEEFEAADFWVLDEGFMSMPEYSLHPQSLLMETTWVCSWFGRLLKKQAELNSSGCSDAAQQIFFADRSPFSAVFYSRRAGELLTPLIQQQIKEVREAAGIEIYTVYMSVEKELLWSRIQDRLSREPERKKYDEDKRAWMEKTVDFYDNFTWDLTVTNNHTTMPELMRDILCRLSLRSERLKAIMCDDERPGREYFRERLGSDDVVTPPTTPQEEDKKMLGDEVESLKAAAASLAKAVLQTPKFARKENLGDHAKLLAVGKSKVTTAAFPSADVSDITAEVLNSAKQTDTEEALRLASP